MKCPHCGFEQPYTTTFDGKRYRDAVEKRLEEYGYPERMNPQKNQAATALRKVIAIRYGITGKAGGSMLPEDADRAICGLNEILPAKEVPHDR
jgi:hypothetical protein